MMRVVAVAAVAAVAVGASASGLSAEERERFVEFTSRFGRVYGDSAEAEKRSALFASRLRAARAHNSRSDVSWTKAEMGPFMDRDASELAAMRGARRPHAGWKSEFEHEYPFKTEDIDLSALPSHVDWRTKGVVTPVKDQGQCGSCWTFATAETIESFAAIKSKSGHLYTLSEEQVAQCINPQTCGGTGGCEGGIVEAAYDGLVKMGGIASEWRYPYTSYFGTTGTCSFNITRTVPVVKLSGYTKLPVNEYAPLMHAVANEGPIAITVDASTWHEYQGGVFDGCNQTNPTLDHAVVLVGYGTDPVHGDYWLVRNSWSPSFGESGYIRLRRSADWRCGWDTKPTEGDECKGGPIERVCGTCGIWVDSAFPHVVV